MIEFLVSNLPLVILSFMVLFFGIGGIIIAKRY